MLPDEIDFRLGAWYTVHRESACVWLVVGAGHIPIVWWPDRGHFEIQCPAGPMNAFGRTGRHARLAEEVINQLITHWPEDIRRFDRPYIDW